MWLLFTPVSITTLIDTEDACFILNGISPIAKGDLKWRDALLVTGTVNSNDLCLHKVLYLVKGRCYRSAGTGKSLLYLFWWCQKTIPYYLMFYKKCTKGTKRRIQVGTAIKCKYVFKLYAYDKYNLAKTYKSCTIICNILRVENQVFFKVY